MPVHLCPGEIRYASPPAPRRDTLCQSIRGPERYVMPVHSWPGEIRYASPFAARRDTLCQSICGPEKYVMPVHSWPGEIRYASPLLARRDTLCQSICGADRYVMPVQSRPGEIRYASPFAARRDTVMPARDPSASHLGSSESCFLLSTPNPLDVRKSQRLNDVGREPFRQPTGDRSANLPGTLPQGTRGPVNCVFIKHTESTRCP